MNHRHQKKFYPSPPQKQQQLSKKRKKEDLDSKNIELVKFNNEDNYLDICGSQWERRA